MRTLRALFLCLFWALACASWAAADVDYERLDGRLRALMQDPEMVGLAVAVIEGGEIRFAKGYGVTRVGGDPVTADTVFRWASVSKSVASTTTGLLAAEDRLALTDPISNFGGSLRLPGGGESRATLEDLLSHRIGIVPNAYDTRLEDGRDPAEIRKALGALKAVCPPGDCHTYQNVAFDAVTEAIEAATGQFYADVVEARVFAPLNMATASASLEGLTSALSWARPHRTRRGRAPLERQVQPSYYRVPAAGGINGSILDLAKFARAQMGRVADTLPQTVLDEIQTPRVYTFREQSWQTRRYGGQMKDARYALGLRSYKYGERRVVGHRGAVEGYRALILFDPEIDAGVVALWNSSSRQPVGVQYEVMDMVYGLPPRDWLGVDG